MAWNTGKNIDLTNYNQFTITPNANYLLTLTSLTFTELTNENSGGGGSTWALRSSLDNYTTNLGTGSASTSSSSSLVTLPSASFTNISTVTFRLYLTTAKSPNTNWLNDNVTLNGTIVLYRNTE